MKREKLAAAFTDAEIEELEQLMQDRADRARGRAVIDMRFVRALRDEEREDAAPWWQCRAAYVEEWRARWEAKETKRAEVIRAPQPLTLYPAKPEPAALAVPVAPVATPDPVEHPIAPRQAQKSLMGALAQALRKAAAWMESL